MGLVTCRSYGFGLELLLESSDLYVHVNWGLSVVEACIAGCSAGAWSSHAVTRRMRPTFLETMLVSGLDPTIDVNSKTRSENCDRAATIGRT